MLLRITDMFCVCERERERDTSPNGTTFNANRINGIPQLVNLTTHLIYTSPHALTVVMFQVEVFWVVIPCSVMVGYQRFRGPCCLHLQSSEL
jgi:hypothetical protein